MRRILVPLDGSHLAESILPDARRLAGQDGELILIRDVYWVRYDPDTGSYTTGVPGEEARRYLQRVAARLRRQGVKVSTHRQTVYDVAGAIDAAALHYGVDMVACATHGRGPLGRLVHGGVAWRALVNSPVPVLLHHDGSAEDRTGRGEPKQRHILVPLDGSPFGESAIPVALELAREWHAPLWLVRVVCQYPIPNTAFAPPDMRAADSLEEEITEARTYLEKRAHDLPANTQTEVLLGASVAGELIQLVGDRAITDIVMSSHGRNGLARVILGSVADELVHRLHVPIVVVPVLAAQRLRMAQEEPKEPVPTAAAM